MSENMSNNLAKAENGSGTDDIWDDTLLIKAYDDSVKLAREELARRIASSTNSQSGENAVESGTKSTKSGEPVLTDQTTAPSFKVGDYARATYDDGIDYEAKILFIDENEGTCEVKYIGYDNNQEVRLSDLVPSWGKKARRIQFNKAKEAVPLSGDETLPFVASGNENNKKSKTQCGSNHFSFGAVPPPPPMPPMLTQSHNFEDSEHLSAMLMSWYMSGYYTGVYQGMQMAKGKPKPRK